MKIALLSSVLLLAVAGCNGKKDGAGTVAPAAQLPPAKEVTLTLMNGMTLTGMLPGWERQGSTEDVLAERKLNDSVAYFRVMSWDRDASSEQTAQAEVEKLFDGAWALKFIQQYVPDGSTIVTEGQEPKVLASHEPLGTSAWVTAVEWKHIGGDKSNRSVFGAVFVATPDVAVGSDVHKRFGFHCEFVLHTVKEDKVAYAGAWRQLAEACSKLRVKAK